MRGPPGRPGQAGVEGDEGPPGIPVSNNFTVHCFLILLKLCTVEQNNTDKLQGIDIFNCFVIIHMDSNFVVINATLCKVLLFSERGKQI